MGTLGCPPATWVMGTLGYPDVLWLTMCQAHYDVLLILGCLCDRLYAEPVLWSSLLFFFPFSSCVCCLLVCGHEYAITHSCVRVHECGYPRLILESPPTIVPYPLRQVMSMKTRVYEHVLVYLLSLLCRSPISALQAWILSCAQPEEKAGHRAEEGPLYLMELN